MEGGYLDHNPAWRTYKYAERSIHVCRSAVKTTGDEIIVKAPKTTAGNRCVYFSAEMESLLRKYEAFCAAETARQDLRKLTKDDYVFRRKGMQLPMTPSTFTWRFKKILRANNLPDDLNVHSLRHTAASLFIASGTDVGTVAGLLGYSQPSTTLDNLYPRVRQKQESRQPDHAEQLGDLNLTVKSYVLLRYDTIIIVHKKSVKSYDFTDFLVRPTRFERATYRVGVFRRILIKCCIFKALRVFTGFAANYRTFAKALKTLDKTNFSDLRTVVVKQSSERRCT